MLPSYLLLDLETTGGNPATDRIIEIAAVRVEQGREVARWSTLVNPGRWVSPLITDLTGIDNAMVAEAPAFESVASRLLELLDGAVLVAHNARFDHGFLKNAFERMRIDLRVPSLCTVRLSRSLYPQHKGHGLDAIMRRHGLHSSQRHRAMGDVDLVQQWLALACRELGTESVARAAQALIGGAARVPPHLETVLQDIPQAPGVYLMYGASRQPLFIGKGVQLRSLVQSHFQHDRGKGRDLRLAQETQWVDYRRTAGELGALLLAHTLVDQLQPAYNRRPGRKMPARGREPAAGASLPRVRPLEPSELPGWPFPGCIGVRENDPHSGRSDIHVFDRWCHLGTVHDESELQHALDATDPLRFDLDIYRLLHRRLHAATQSAGKGLIRLDRRASPARPQRVVTFQALEV